MTDMRPRADVPVIEGIEFHGRVNTSDPQLLANIRDSIALGLSAGTAAGATSTTGCVWSAAGPRSMATFDELRRSVFHGRQGRHDQRLLSLVYRAEHPARGADHPRCAAVECALPGAGGAAVPVSPGLAVRAGNVGGGRGSAGCLDLACDRAGRTRPRKLLIDYYGGRWLSIGHGPIGGTTAGVRAIALLRTLGFLRFDLFGMDSCYWTDTGMRSRNRRTTRDKAYHFTVNPSGHPELAREF